LASACSPPPTSTSDQATSVLLPFFQPLSLVPLTPLFPFF
jgi:serine palmitoyltransferase